MMAVDECNLYIPKAHLRERKLPILRKTIKIVWVENPTWCCDPSHYFLIEPLCRATASSLCFIAAPFIANFSQLYIYLLKKGKKTPRNSTYLLLLVTLNGLDTEKAVRPWQTQQHRTGAARAARRLFCPGKK